MGKFIDLTGQRFGRLIVIKRAENVKSRHIIWLCRCDCGKEVKTRWQPLLSGRTMSCGCYRKDINTKHGMSRTRLGRIWREMNARCYNENNNAFKDYGGRGIGVCKEWGDNVLAFCDWADKNGYKDNLTIERVDVNGNYDPGNCKWVTMKEQENNRTNNRLITYNGKTKTAMQWSDELGVNYRNLLWRIYNGWPVGQALGIEKRRRA